MREKRKVLIVEDDDSIRKMMKLVLASRYDVVEAASATEALGLLKKMAIDGVVSDYYMPQMNGLEFVRTLRLDRRWQNLPVVMVSSFLTKDHLVTATAAGVSTFLSKPFELKIFQDVVHQTFSASH